MADVDIDPFGSTTGLNQDLKSQRMNILLFLRLPQEEDQLGNWNANKKHHSEDSQSQRTSFMKDYVKDLYKKLSEKIGEIPEPFHNDYFKLEGGELYYLGNRKPLMTEGKLK